MPFYCLCSQTVLVLTIVLAGCIAEAAHWPRWRGAVGNAVSRHSFLPTTWGTKDNVCWKTAVPGEGASSPIVWDGYVFITSAFDEGARRALHCLDRDTGAGLWTREIEDDNPEITSALTGYAAPTPVTDGAKVVAFFGNAGVVCYDFKGEELWRRDFGEFESELGFASSPVIYGDRVILLCDHDGNRRRTFDSFLIAIDLETGEVCWKSNRRGLYRSWSTPIVVPAADGHEELIVNAQDELRGYDPQDGQHLWTVKGMSGWVTPSPVFGDGLVFAASGRDGPVMAVRPGGRGDVTETHVVWKQEGDGPYVCSPLLAGGLLYVHDEQGILICYEAATGKMLYRERLGGRFYGSGVAGDSKLYLTSEAGITYVIKLGRQYVLLAKNSLDEECLASPAISNNSILIRTRHQLYCLGSERRH